MRQNGWCMVPYIQYPIPMLSAKNYELFFQSSTFSLFKQPVKRDWYFYWNPGIKLPKISLFRHLWNIKQSERRRNFILKDLSQLSISRTKERANQINWFISCHYRRLNSDTIKLSVICHKFHQDYCSFGAQNKKGWKLFKVKAVTGNSGDQTFRIA